MCMCLCVYAGGLVGCPGFTERFTTELQPLVPDNIALGVNAPPVSRNTNTQFCTCDTLHVVTRRMRSPRMAIVRRLCMLRPMCICVCMRVCVCVCVYTGPGCVCVGGHVKLRVPGSVSSDSHDTSAVRGNRRGRQQGAVRHAGAAPFSPLAVNVKKAAHACRSTLAMPGNAPSAESWQEGTWRHPGLHTDVAVQEQLRLHISTCCVA